LLDQQAVVLQAITSIIDVGVIQRGDGIIDLTVGGGRALVVGVHSYALSAVSQPPNGFAAITTDGAAVTTDITSEISGGEISGLLRVRDALIPSYAAQLDQLAYSVATDVNTLTLSGFDLDGNAGVNFFDQPATVSGAAKQMSVNAAVAADTDLVVAAGAASPGNNDIARAIAALQDSVMTGTTTRPVDAWGSLVYSVALDAGTAGRSRESHGQILRQLQSLRDQISGVSLDEEAAMLLRFQRAYEANARFFQVADQTLDLLMRMVGE
jgi:flagellar hook-associated protein 1 FlgK